MLIARFVQLVGFAVLVTGQVSIIPEGNLQACTSLILKCSVTSFTAGATWSHDGGVTALTECYSLGICTDGGSGNYNYSSDANNIYVEILNLDSQENSVQWTCKHQTFTNTYTVNVIGSCGGTATGDTSSCAYVIAIAFAFQLLTGLLCVILFVFKLEAVWRCFVCCCVYDREHRYHAIFVVIMVFVILLSVGFLVDMVILLVLYYAHCEFEVGLVIGGTFGVWIATTVICTIIFRISLYCYVRGDKGRQTEYSGIWSSHIISCTNSTVDASDGNSQKQVTLPAVNAGDRNKKSEVTVGGLQTPRSQNVLPPISQNVNSSVNENGSVTQ